MRKNIKGSTLIEIVVTLLLVAMFLAFIGSFFLSGGKYFQRAQQKNEDKFIGDSVADLIDNTIKFAGQIEIVGQEDVSKYANIVSVKNNKLALENENLTSDNIYSDSFYNERKMSYTVSKITDTSVELSANVLNTDDETVYSATSIIDFPNLALSGNIIEMTEDSITNAKISYEEKKEEISGGGGGDYIPGTNVRVNSVWPDFSEFYYNGDPNGNRKSVLLKKGTTYFYDNEFYILIKTSLIYISSGDPTPANLIAQGSNSYDFFNVSTEIVYDYNEYSEEQWDLLDIQKGEKVLKDGKYYVYTADGYWGDKPPNHNYFEIQYPLP